MLPKSSLFELSLHKSKPQSSCAASYRCFPAPKLCTDVRRSYDNWLWRKTTASRRQAYLSPEIRSPSAKSFYSRITGCNSSSSLEAMDSTHALGLKRPSLVVAATAGIAIAAASIVSSARHSTEVPALQAPDTTFHQRILEDWKSVKQPYAPFPTMTNAHVDTIFAALTRRSPGVAYRRELLETPDGGCVALDWEPQGETDGISEDTPVIIFLPGLTGGSEDTYVQYAVQNARRHRRWRTVVFNSRGTSGSPVRTAQFYSASYTGDLRHVVAYVRRAFPRAPLAAVGWSIGANILVRYLGEESDRCPLSAAVSLCNPFNLVISNENLKHGFNRIYDANLGVNLGRIFAKHAHLFEEAQALEEQAAAAVAESAGKTEKVMVGDTSADDHTGA